MTTSKNTRVLISTLMLSISALFWILLLVNPGNLLTIQHCAVTTTGSSRASLQMLLAMNPITSLLAGWALMVIAMMLPKLILPVRYICERSLRSRRFWSALLFVSGYTGVWMVAAFFMIAVIFWLNLLMPKSYLPAIAAGLIAIIWQFSPVKQRCLNRGHDHRALAAFGWAANRDAFLFGVVHGVWCVGSGWALMLFPMLLPEGHNIAMIFVTFIMLSEHLENPRPPQWRLSFRNKLMRIALAQTQIKLKQVLDLKWAFFE